MDRKTAIEWIEQIKHRISGGDEDFDKQRKEALDMAIVDMKICNANNAGWISVKDRMPEVYERVLTYDKRNGVRENWLIAQGIDWSQGYHITHWIPLPEPPKEGKRE